MVKSYTTTKSMTGPGHPALAIDISTEKQKTKKTATKLQNSRIVAGNPRACSDIQHCQQKTQVALGRTGPGLQPGTEQPLSFLLHSCILTCPVFMNKNPDFRHVLCHSVRILSHIDLFPNKDNFKSLFRFKSMYLIQVKSINDKTNTEDHEMPI